MKIKWVYGVWAIIFSITVVIDLLFLFQSWVDGVALHSQLQQHFYINPLLTIFFWYLALKKTD